MSELQEPLCRTDWSAPYFFKVIFNTITLRREDLDLAFFPTEHNDHVLVGQDGHCAGSADQVAQDPLRFGLNVVAVGVGQVLEVGAE